MEKITKSLLALMLMLVGLVSAKAGDAPVPPKAPDAPAAPKASALVTDGSVQQYLYNVGAKGFFIGANDWGTRASISTEKGYWVKMTANGETFTLTNEAKGGNAADCQGVDQIWVDGAGRAGDGKWTVTIAEDNSFKLGNTNVAGFLSVLPSKNDTKLYMSEADEAQNVWIAVSEADYAAYQEAIPAYQEAVKKYNEDYAQYQKDYAAWLRENYKAGEDISALAPADWAGQGGNYGGLANPAKEKYVDGANAPLKAGEVMTQTIDGLKNGKYIVLLEAAASYTSGRGFECPTGDGLAVAFANDQEENLPIVDRGWVGEGQQNFYALETEVTDGTLKYGVKNLADAGNWYVVRLASIAMIPEKETWFTDNLFCYKDKTINLVDRDTEVNWTADPKDVSNGVIKVVAGIKAGAETQDDHNTQFWIRGAEVVDANDLSKGAFAKGTGFKVTFKVKADGEYEVLPGYYRSKAGSTTAKNDKNAWNHISYFAENLKVTTEWQTVSYVCMSPDDLFTSFGLNLADKTNKTVRTFYFDDVKIEGRGGSEWYLNNEFHAKDYKDTEAKYTDSDTPHPAARFVADAEGGYVEVISNAKADKPYNSQLWIKIPEKYVGSSTKMTVEIQASKAIKTPESFQATATGNGWGCNASPGSGVDFTVGEWTTLTRILKTQGVKSNGVYKDKQADFYCLDLSEEGGEAITYKFRNVKFEQAAEDWYEQNVIVAKDPAVDYEDGKEYDIPAAPYVFGTGEEGGYIEVKSKANPATERASQIFFEIPAALRNGQVELVMTVKASKAVKAKGQLHKSNNGGGYTDAAAPAAEFTTDWNEISLIIDPTTQEGLSNYVLNIALDAEGVTYDFDNVAFKKYVAPVDPSSYEEWYTALGEQGVALVTRGEVGRDGDQAPIYTKGTGEEGDYLEVAAKTSGDRYATQFFVKLSDEVLAEGTKVKVTMNVKASEAVKVGTQAQNGVGNYAGWNTFGEYEFTTDWKEWAIDYTVPNGMNLNTIALDLCYSSSAEARSFFFDNIKVELVEPVDPTTLDWAKENILKNGDLKSDDMREFVLKNNDVEDPEMLPAEKSAIGDGFEIGIETAARPTKEDGSVGGNDYDAQFFVRLPSVLPKGSMFNLEFDVYAEEVNTLAIQAHNEPGQWKANLSSVKTDPSGEGVVHYQEYLTAPEDMRSIAINLAVATKATYGFSNFSVKTLTDDQAAIKAATEAADATSLWAETLALNEACYAGRTTETEGKGYSEDLVKALTDAIAAGKAELKKDAAEVTAESLTAATKAITDAIADLTKGEQLLPAPETDPDYANFVEIPLDQQDVENGDVHLAPKEDKGSYTQFTTTDGICVVFKMKDIDVTDCDYITIKFAKPAPAGQSYAVWTGNDNKGIDEGVSEIKYVFAEDPNCKIQNGILPEVSIISIFTGAGKDVSVYGVYKHKAAPALAYTDLTKEMFFVWSDWTDADATAQAGCAYEVGTSSGMPYGDGSVINYADLSEYATLEVTTTEGAPRFLFNRDVKDGQWNENEADSHLIDNTKGGWSAKYFTSKDNGDGSTTYIVDIAALVADKGYAHLHSIKGANWANTTVTDMKLGYVGEKPALPIPVAINGIAEGASVKDGKYFINGQIVIVKNGVKYNAAGVAIK